MGSEQKLILGNKIPVPDVRDSAVSRFVDGIMEIDETPLTAAEKWPVVSAREKMLQVEQRYTDRMALLDYAERMVNHDIIIDISDLENPGIVSQRKKQLRRKGMILAALYNFHGIIADACSWCNLSRAAYRNWYNDDPVFRELADEAQEVAIDFAESKLFQNMEKNFEASIIFFLKTRGKHRGYVEHKTETKNINLKYSDWTEDEIQNELDKLSGRIALASGTPKKTV